MLKRLVILAQTVRSTLKSRQDFALDDIALRQQVAVSKRKCPRPQLTNADRKFWVLLSRVWPAWRSVIHAVQPATVVRWHRQGFRRFWRWKSRRRKQRKIDLEIRLLVQRTCFANPLWGAPCVHGLMLELGFDASEATVSNYMVRRRGPPSQTWQAFLDNHGSEIFALDFFTVPTATFRILFVLFILSQDRRRILHFNVTAHPSAEWTARQLLEASGTDSTPRFLLRDNNSIYGEAFHRQVAALGIEEVTTAPRFPWQHLSAERVIGSIRRECLDHMILLGSRHLKKILANYVDYSHSASAHLSWNKDAPDFRSTQPRGHGRVIKLRRVCGLHHEYVRMAA